MVMKTNILLLGLLVLGFLSFAYGESAYSTNAYYAVMFDERGLASSALRLDYVNNNDAATDRIDLWIPGEDARIISAYVREDCQPKNGSYGYYGDECYYGYRFVPAKVSAQGGGSYSIALDSSLKRGGRTSVLIFYRAFGYASDGLLGTGFAFETPSFGFDVESSRVAIDVDEDLILKEGGSSGSYNQMRSTVLAGSSYGGSSNLQSALSSSYSYISYARGYVLEKSTLLSGETFVVRGTYGREWAALYLPEIAAVLLILAGCGIFVHRKAEEAKGKRNDDAARAQPEAPKRAGAEQGRMKMPAAARPGLAETAVFSFMCAVAFALAVSLVAMGIVWGKAKLDPGPLALLGLASWAGGAALIYIRRSVEGDGLAAATLFAGFSVIVTPFMLLMGLWIASMLLYKPYYYAY